MNYHYLRPLLFQLSPETAHDWTLTTLNVLHKLRLQPKVSLSAPCKILGLNFPNPVGLAAGLDKNGEYIDSLAALGFGFIEIGTVTPRPQPGNPKPRMFRIPKANAIINRLGFNNRGVDYLIEQVKRANYSGILGINIGKNATTSLAKAHEDYVHCFNKVYPYASYVTVNISSPNTPELRQLQSTDYLTKLLTVLKREQQILATKTQRHVPLLVKIAPDLTDNELSSIAQHLLTYEIEGIIATNTTIDHGVIEGLPHANETGGLSGKPLFNKATDILTKLAPLLANKIPIIAVGGIMTGNDALQKFHHGASLVQIYTGLIYQGPKLIRDIVTQYTTNK
ncbi:MAG: quinone-dependent dihydroorotate dehydrogenase [Coxiellaceae bacterium]|nr:MAG: quinone-dependent dihydroorotate dehydrogenase [Coxiellaceae bacterium]